MLCEVAALEKAFNEPDIKSLIAACTTVKHTPVPPHYSDVLRNLVDAMLQPEPEQRPTVADLLRVPVLQQYVTGPDVLPEGGAWDEASEAMSGGSPAPPVAPPPPRDGPEVSQLLTAYEGRESCRVSVTNSNYYRPCRQAVFVRHSSGRPSAAANVRPDRTPSKPPLPKKSPVGFVRQRSARHLE